MLYLLIDKGGNVSTDDAMDALHVTRPTALRTMTELNVVGLVETYEYKEKSDTQFTKHIRLKNDFNWFLSEDFKKLREGFMPIGNRENRSKKANKEKIPPYTHNNTDPSSDQIETFWSTFSTMEKEQESLPSQIDRDTVSGEVLRQRLVETGKFQYNDATLIVERMCIFGIIDKVSCDTYRRRKK